VASCEPHRIRESGSVGFPTLQDLRAADTGHRTCEGSGKWRGGRRQRRAGGSARDQQDPNLPFNPSSFAPLRLCVSHKNFFAQRRKDAKFFRIKRSRFEARRHLGAYPIPDFQPSALFQSKIQNSKLPLVSCLPIKNPQSSILNPQSSIINLFLFLSHPKSKIQNSKSTPLLLSPVSCLLINHQPPQSVIRNPQSAISHAPPTVRMNPNQ